MNGILVIDKPQGWTSHDVVNFVRRRFNIKKAGHAGTLDPMATGLLVLLLGSYTKLSQEFTAEFKEYRAVLTLGKVTDTQDATGRVIATQAVPPLKHSDIEAVLEKFTGELQQVPPMVSAVSVNGKRLYKLARQGKEVKREPRKIIIEKLELDSFNPPDISISVTCSKGTYIRTLCEDIAKALGSAGHMSYLRRTRSGRFHIEDAVGIDKLKNITEQDLRSLVMEK